MEKRYLLFFIFSLIIVQLTLKYMQVTAPEPPPGEEPAPGVASDSARTSPASIEPAPSPTDEARPSAPRQSSPPPQREPAELVPFRTEKFDIEFSTRGAVPVKWDIIDPEFIPPLEDEPEAGEKVADRGVSLIDPQLADIDQAPLPFEIVLKERGRGGLFRNELNEGLYSHRTITRDGLRGIEFTFEEPASAGLGVVKTYLFADDGFLGRFEIKLTNTGESNLSFDLGGAGLGVTLGPGLGGKMDVSAAMARWFSVNALIKSGDVFKYYTLKYSGGDRKSETAGYSGATIDWGGIQNMYFLSALVPDEQTALNQGDAFLPGSLLGSAADDDSLKDFPVLELYTPSLDLAAGDSREFRYLLYMGPKQQRILREAGHDLDRVLFYNSWPITRGLCLVLMRLLGWFHSIFASWGIAIIMLTVMVKLLTFPLVHKGMKSQAKVTQEMAKLKPHIDKLNEKYKTDPQRKQQEMMKLYREHNVNPLGMLKGCMWMMIQIPIFFALYKLLYQTIDLRGAPFWWFDDLSKPDRLIELGFTLPLIGNYFNLLPIITAMTQMASSKLTVTPPTDPQQAQMQKMMLYFMPIFILVITYSFPSGLMLYWLISNLWQVLQQYWVNKLIKRPPVAPSTAPAKA